MRISDWSSDVCSSDLEGEQIAAARRLVPVAGDWHAGKVAFEERAHAAVADEGDRHVDIMRAEASRDGADDARLGGAGALPDFETFHRTGKQTVGRPPEPWLRAENGSTADGLLHYH